MKQNDTLRAVLLEKERRQKEEKLRYFYAPGKPVHIKQLEWHKCQKRNKWSLSGNRCGKTVAGAIETLVSLLGESARKYIESWPEEIRQEYEPMITRFKGHAEGWVVSLTNEVQRDVAQKELLKWLPKCEIKSISTRIGRQDDPENSVIDTLVLTNGNVIGFKSCDQGRAKFQGTSKNLIWFDEEPPKEIYDECMMRTLDCKGSIIGTMTPLMGLTFVYDDIYLNDTKPIGKQDREIYCVQWSWDDNPFLNNDEKQRLEAMLDPAELEARKSGRFIMPGKCVFDKMALLEMQDKCYAGERGNLEWVGKKVQWIPDKDGEYEVWFHPNDQDEYLNADDVAEGLEHGDFDACGILNRTKLRFEAVFHGKVDPDIYADYIHKLCVYYHKPLAAPENNNHGGTTISHLKLVYQNIYRSMIVDQTVDKEREKLGWSTTPKTRPYVVDAIKKAVRERTLKIYWKRFIDEAQSFVTHPGGKQAARNGYWDDCVMMMGIMMYVHNTSTMTKDLPSPGIPGYEEDKAGWKSDGTFIHESILEDRRKAREKEEEWDNDNDW
jgi:phage terminase large subunit-like protein